MGEKIKQPRGTKGWEMKFDKKFILFGFLLLGVIYMVIIILPLMLSDEGRYSTLYAPPPPNCDFPIFWLQCTNDSEFNDATNTFRLTLSNTVWKGESKRDYIITEILLTQILPEPNMNCWLDTATLPDESKSTDPLGLLVVSDQERTVTLTCSEFGPEEIEGVWELNATAYELKDGRLVPALRIQEMNGTRSYNYRRGIRGGYVLRNYSLDSYTIDKVQKWASQK